MTTEVLTIVLKGDGSGLTGTLRTGAGDVQRFGAVLDATSGKTTAAGAASRRAARDVDMLSNSARRSGGSFREWATDLNTVRGTLATLGISLVAREVLGAGLAMDRLERSTAAALGSQSAAARELGFVREQAERLGIYFPTLAQGYAGLAAATRGTNLEGEKTRQIFLGVAEAGRAMNLGTEQMQGILTAVQQIAGKGTVSMEELRQQLGDRLPGAMQIAARSMDMPIGQFIKMVSEGKVLSEVFLPRFAEEMRKSAAAGVELARTSPAAEFERLKTALFAVGVAFARSGVLDALGSAARQAATYLQALVRSGAIERIADGMATALKITAAWFLLYRGVPAVVAGLKAIRDAYIGIVLAQQMGIRGSGLFAAAAISGLQGIKTAAGVLFAAFAGWQIGTWLRDNFVEARMFGILFVEAMLRGWIAVKQGGQLAWAAIKGTFLGAINVMRDGLAGFIEFHARLANLIPDFMGGDGIEQRLTALATTIRSTSSAGDDFAASAAKINAEANAASAEVRNWSVEAIRLEQQQELAKRATEGATEATDSNAEATATATELTAAQRKELERLRQAQLDFARDNARMAASLAGPEAEAWFEFTDGVNEATAALAKHEATAAAVIERKRLLAQQRDEAIADLAREADVLGRVHAEMEQEVRLSALSAEQRTVEEAVIRAVADAHEEAIRQKKAELALTPQQIASLREYVAAQQDVIIQNEEMVRASEELRDSLVGAANDAARAFGDWFADGFRGAKDFAGKLKDIFKRMLSDLVTMMLQNNLVRPFQQWLQQAMGTGTSGGSTGALTQGGGLMSGFGNIMSSGFDKLLSGIGSLFGMGGQAATGMQTAVQAGMTLAQQNGVAVAGSSAGAGAGATTAAAGAFAKMIPIIGWIYAGMQLNGGLYDGGWKIGAHGNFMDAMKGSAATGSIGLTATTFAAGTLDDLLQRLGVSGKWASMLSGSSVLAKLFGRSDPKIQASGITGSYGFNGFSGQAYADVKQKGGLFRSDKNWTEYAALDSQIDQAFDAAAQAVNKAATSLAEQAGMDISQQLASVRINIGKLQLSNDAEEAKAQLEAALNAMIETLSAKAIEAMGFAALLDDGYKATEIMTALSAAIQLVTGNVGELERSLTALEVQKVQQAVEYFERMAETAGTTLAAAIEEITGLLANYGNLIGGVRQQIATHGLNDYQKAQLEVELGYRDMVTQANALAKALGLSGARSEDLATLEQWRAMQMADLAEQYAAQQAAAQQTWLQDLSMSDLSPLRDDQKLASVMELLNTAVANNDMSRAQDLAEQALRLGRDLYASGEDYNALYAQVTGLVGDIAPQSMEDLQGLTNEELANLADLVAGLPSQIAQELFNLLIAPPAGTEIPTTPTQPLPAPPTPNPPSGGGGGGGGSGGYDEPSCVAFDMFLDDDMRAIDAQVGDRYDTLDPQDGYSRRPVLVRGATVLQPCVRIVTESGAALVCSRSTPFTDPDAPADLPEYSTLAPDMLDKRVFVQHRGRVRVERVTRVLDAGDREVVPLDFGGRSFPAGERRGLLIYSHNMMKSESYSSMGIMSPEMASSFGTLNDSILQVVEAVNTTNARMEAAQLEALSNGTRGGLGGKSAPQY